MPSRLKGNEVTGNRCLRAISALLFDSRAVRFLSGSPHWTISAAGSSMPPDRRQQSWTQQQRQRSLEPEVVRKSSMQARLPKPWALCRIHKTSGGCSVELPPYSRSSCRTLRRTWRRKEVTGADCLDHLGDWKHPTELRNRDRHLETRMHVSRANVSPVQSDRALGYRQP